MSARSIVIIAEHAARRESFAFETTMAGRTYARMIPAWRRQGYVIKLIFLALPDAEMAVARVAARVAQGGHDVPEPVIRRRYDAGLRNFHRSYKRLVNFWQLFDNSVDPPRLLDEGANP